MIAAAIAEPAASVKANAPKIVSFEIPIDKIGEVIGPKGKVINTLQQETGADIAVDDDGTVGRVTIGAKESSAVDEARRRIELILDPPSAEVGATYQGRVVNITKFGAFVNILPGRDGLLHISRLGGGKRVERVEDVLNLGDEVTVVVQDIDPQGKISLALIGEDGQPVGGAPAGRDGEEGGAPRASRSSQDRPSRNGGGEHDTGAATGGEGAPRRISFEDEFASQLERDFGDLGPGESAPAPSSSSSRSAPGRSTGPRRRGTRR